jgi:hypothetical protein
MLLNQVQQDLQQHKLVSVGNGVPQLPLVEDPLMVHGIPVEDAVEQLQLEIQVIQSRLRSDAASIGGHVFESYDNTSRWVVDNYSP